MNLQDLIPIIAILSSVALPIGFGMYLGLMNIRTRHKENIELIKQGIVPPPKSSPTPNKYRSLRNGFLCLGIGIGVIVGYVLSEALGVGSESPSIMAIMGAPILIFLGLAYVLFFMATKEKDLDE